MTCSKAFQKATLLILVTLLVVCTCVVLSAVPAHAKSKIDKSTLTIKLGEEEDLRFGEYDDWLDDYATYYGSVTWSSSNKKVAKISSVFEYDSSCTIEAVGVGKATIKARGDNGDTVTCVVTVKAVKPSFDIGTTIKYGAKKVTYSIGKLYAGAKAKMKIGGKTRKAKVNSKGKVTFKKLPLAKCGSKVKVSVTMYGKTGTSTAKVDPGSRQYATFYVKSLFKGKKIAKVKFSKFVRGDVLKLKIGSKTYKKKIKKDGKQTIKFKIKRSVAGKKVVATLYDHFGKKIQRDETIVWRGKYIYEGDSKRQVRMTYGFGEPDHINYYTTNEQWCYDDAYLYFYGGKLRSWQIFG